MEVSAAVKDIDEQCSKIKTAISSVIIENLPKDFFSTHDINMIHDIFSSYPMNYLFPKDLLSFIWTKIQYEGADIDV
ncbi:hypothetical protein BDF14DRAFT_1862426 [Spinellus fusiger]|nr:hypothetical protein BDF14DRAFT_1867578 [Spinellus fusiger]KAI7861944.1 hypothetical protein BDF14DRAFT_1862426 [Spinellus fusiger]